MLRVKLVELRLPMGSDVAVRAPLVKLTRPKLYEALALPRPRLFALLDEAATRPIVWLCAAPGAGKTTLVASYLEARHRRQLWYQCDRGDADSATFLHYLRIAAQQLAGKRAAALPQFTSEPQPHARSRRRVLRAARRLGDAHGGLSSARSWGALQCSVPESNER